MADKSVMGRIFRDYIYEKHNKSMQVFALAET